MAADITDNFYDNREEAEIRLSRSLISYEGRPVYVDQVSEDYADGLCRLHIRELPYDENTKASRKIINSPGFRSFQPIKTGWFNGYQWCNERGVNLHATYFSRRGARRRRQGLSNDNLFKSNVDPQSILLPAELNTVIRDPGFADSLKGVFPTLDEALATLTRDTSMAIGLEWCIHRDGSGFTWLFYQTDKIGMFFRGSLFLFDNFAYLREMVQEAPCLPNHFEIGVE